MSPSPDFRYLVGIMFLRTPGGWFVGNHANVKIKGFSLELGLESLGYKECTMEGRLAIQNPELSIHINYSEQLLFETHRNVLQLLIRRRCIRLSFSLEERAKRNFILGLMRAGRYRSGPERVPLRLGFQRAAMQRCGSRRRFLDTFENCSPSQ